MKRLAVLTLAAATATTLAACEKPNPGVTVFSGTSSQRAQAICWSPDATQSVTAKGCAADIVSKAAAGGEVPIVNVVPGSTVGISVDPVVADHGWIPAVNGQQLSETPITSTYFRFTFPDLTQSSSGFELRIQAVGESAKDLRGLWVYKLSTTPS